MARDDQSVPDTEGDRVETFPPPEAAHPDDVTAAAPAAPESAGLASRYDRTLSAKRRDRWLLGAGAAAMLAVVTAWVLWAGWDKDQADLQFTDTAYTIPDARHVDITFTINTPRGTAVTCALQALNEDFAIVGWRIVSYPGSDSRVTTHRESIRTTQQSTTGLIKTCWLT
ncbi:DUF4307 domain-containing protein [Leifsonia xyli]|uniref:DUF4307 domain-containing protein n=1 Tax=Leifsonia xyli TaxID=1575 RepID=UPI0002EF51AD|nr:DUF4307 domain-containing protein [Leifsonia xyli]